MWWWWWYHSLTAHQHQKGHTVPKQVIMIATSIQVASLRTALCESIRYQAKSEQNVRQDLIPRERHVEAALMNPGMQDVMLSKRYCMSVGRYYGWTGFTCTYMYRQFRRDKPSQVGQNTQKISWNWLVAAYMYFWLPVLVIQKFPKRVIRRKYNFSHIDWTLQ